MHVVIFAILVFVAFTPPDPPEMEEGIIVNFGTDETGLGSIEPSAPAVQAEPPPPPPTPVQRVQNEEPLLTQDHEEAPEVKKADPEAEKKRLEKLEAERKLKVQQAEAERIKREQELAERKRIEQEEAERKRIEAERKRQEDIINRTRTALEGSKNVGTTSTSEGEAGGTGNQGVPTGAVDSQNRGEGGGFGTQGTSVSYNLGGRGMQSLPKPEYKIQEEGRVVVEVRVDRDGKVIQVNAPARGTTATDLGLLNKAKEAAMKARFEPKPDGPAVQTGTITYNFKLN